MNEVERLKEALRWALFQMSRPPVAHQQSMGDRCNCIECLRKLVAAKLDVCVWTMRRYQDSQVGTGTFMVPYWSIDCDVPDQAIEPIVNAIHDGLSLRCPGCGRKIEVKS